MTLICPPAHPRASAAKLRQWWSRAWLRMVEESRYDDADWARARRLARVGDWGPIRVSAGSVVAQPAGQPAYAARLHLAPLTEEECRTLAALAERPERLASLRTGALDLGLVEEAEELGLEFIGAFGSLAARCTCAGLHPWCVHALALAIHLGWLMDADARVLLTLRGFAADRFAPPAEALSAEALSAGGGGTSIFTAAPAK